MPRLSVIIPVYNMEKYLAKCLDSVISKSDFPYEIVIVNDGSTDASLAIAESYRERFPSLISIVSTENMGLGSARNTGMDHSSGEYLYFPDSDDSLAPGAIDAIIGCLDEDFDICIFDSITVSEDGRELRYVRGCRPGTALSLDTYPELLLELPNVWNKIYRRSLFTDHGIRFPGRAWFEDLRTILKLYVYADKIIYKPEAWYRYLLRKGSITNSSNAARNLEMIDAMDDLLGFYREQGRYEQLRDVLEYLAFHSEFLTSAVRANLADRHSLVQEALMQDFLQRFPDYRRNPYVRRISAKHRLLDFLLRHRMRESVHFLMTLNNRLR